MIYIIRNIGQRVVLIKRIESWKDIVTCHANVSSLELLIVLISI